MGGLFSPFPPGEGSGVRERRLVPLLTPSPSPGALVSTHRVFAGDSRSQAPPGNVLPSRLCLDFRRPPAKFPAGQAEPAGHCVPRRSLGTRCVDTNAPGGRGEKLPALPRRRNLIPHSRIPHSALIPPREWVATP